MAKPLKINEIGVGGVHFAMYGKVIWSEGEVKGMRQGEGEG
jgi:hypothetical protein